MSKQSHVRRELAKLARRMNAFMDRCDKANPAVDVPESFLRAYAYVLQVLSQTITLVHEDEIGARVKAIELQLQSAQNAPAGAEAH